MKVNERESKGEYFVFVCMKYMWIWFDVFKWIENTSKGKKKLLKVTQNRLWTIDLVKNYLLKMFTFVPCNIDMKR